MTTLRVIDYLEELTALGPEQAPPVAEAVLDALKVGGEVELTFAGVQGVTTAFTNNLLLLIFAEHSFDALRGRLHFRVGSRLHRETLDRSMRALKELKSSP